MKVSVPFEFTDGDRQLVARFLGYERPATHIECAAWARGQLRGSLAVMAAAPKQPRTFPLREGEGVTHHE